MKLSWAGFKDEVPFREQVKAIAPLGFDTLAVTETGHDPFIRAAVAIEHTERIEIMTGIVVAFARTPMLLAYAAHDLNALSGGRFILGLGSQVKAHITKRFAMPWSEPAERMREMIQAVHAIWDCWYDGKPLDFRGRFYSHTLMTPYFTPTDTRSGRAKIHLAAVGTHMTNVAAEVADGMICHPFTTERYVREVTMPAIEAGLTQTGRQRGDFELTGFPFVATGWNDEALEKSIADTRRQIAFYGSTPAYRGVLELHGWGDLQTDLNALSKQGRWEEMGRLIDDRILEAFAVIGRPEEAARELRRRFDGAFDRMSVNFALQPETLPPILQLLRRGT
ncbi:MAG TPA: TIGR03617 family F420-dependent LLM class oxidoreductase [Alphaproteobacteria bacterium]|nr:TIGR03617 family F420-dependent LLM class oxidoreductase [Alphaproteobacteria bacterium]